MPKKEEKRLIMTKAGVILEPPPDQAKIRGKRVPIPGSPKKKKPSARSKSAISGTSERSAASGRSAVIGMSDGRNR